METAFRPRHFRLVFIVAVSLRADKPSGSEGLTTLDALYRHRQVQWGERVGKMLHWAALKPERDRNNPLLELAHKASMVEEMMKMPHVGRPVLRVLLRDEEHFLERTEDAKAIQQRWSAENKELMAFFNQEKRLTYDAVPMALTKSFKSSTDPLQGMMGNILAGRRADDPKGMVDRDDVQQAKLLLQAGFILIPDA